MPARDLVAAQAALRRSGYKGQPIPLSYAADLPIQGIPATRARGGRRAASSPRSASRSQLNPAPAAAGARRLPRGPQRVQPVELEPRLPGPRELPRLRARRASSGSRAGWARRDRPHIDDLTDTARDSVGDDRAAAYAAWQLAMNARSPFVPLIQPSTRFASGARVTDLPGNPVWTVDLAGIS